MTRTSQVDHPDVGAYALGVLTPDEMDAFEEHLATCDSCGEELDELMDVPVMLAHVELADGDPTEPGIPVVADSRRGAVPVALETTEPGSARPAPAGQPVNGRPVDPATLPGRVSRVISFPDAAERERRRSRMRRLYSVAAAVVLVAGGVTGGLLVGRSDGNQPQVTGSPSVQLLVTGEEFRATDPTTGIVARMGLESKGWGTHVALELARVTGPQQCQLIAIGKDGTNEVAMTWSVPPKGYGTAENPAPLTVHGGTSVKRDQLDRFEVRTLDGQILATIRI